MRLSKKPPSVEGGEDQVFGVTVIISLVSISLKSEESITFNLNSTLETSSNGVSQKTINEAFTFLEGRAVIGNPDPL